MDDMIDISDFRNKATIIKVKILDVEITIKVFFNMNCCQALFESFENGDSYRTAFAKAVFIMYQGTDAKETGNLSESDFNNISDDDFSHILSIILDGDLSLKAEYEKAHGDTQYEKFYRANKAVLSSATKGISESLKQISKTFDALNKPLIASLQSAASTLIIPPVNLSNIQSALTAIQPLPHFEIPPAVFEMPKYDFTSLQTALSAASQVNFPGLSSALASISQPAFDIQNLITPLSDMAQSIQAINEGVAQSLQASITSMTEAATSLLSSIDFSLLLYRKDWNNQREAFLAYGWFYIEELPESLVTDVYERKDELTQTDVDALITSYFRQNKCAALKQMVKAWNKLPYFSCRKSVFHEALVNHSKRYYNSSIMMMTIQTEGVITDFVRLKLQTPRFKVKKALLDIKSKLEDSNGVSIYEFEVFNDIIEKIEAAFDLIQTRLQISRAIKLHTAMRMKPKQRQIH